MAIRANGSRSRGALLGLCFLTWTFVAQASDITETKQATLKTTTARVLDVFSSSDICDKGCKYFGPGLVREVKVDVRASEHSYYKWTHVSGVKTVKFFKHVQVTPGPVTKVHVRTLTKEADAKLLEELEQKTHLEHAPAFDVSVATFTLTPQAEQLEVKVSSMTRISGLMSVFAGAVRKGQKESLDAMFGNFVR